MKYNKYFVSYEEKWYNKLKEVYDFIEINNRIPTQSIKENINTKCLGYWISDNNKKYKYIIGVMTNKEIMIKWKEFREKYLNK